MTARAWAARPRSSQTSSSSQPTTRCLKIRWRSPATCKRARPARRPASITRSSSTAEPPSVARSRSRDPATPSSLPARATNVRCGPRADRNRGTNAPRPRPRFASGVSQAPSPVGERDLGRGARTAAYHAHDLDSVPIAECDARERSARDDLAVVLHRDRARVDAQPLEVVEQGGWLIELYLLAVHLQGDHSKSLMAA